MKKLFKAVFGLCVLVALLLFGLQPYLQYGLTDTIRTVVLPKLKTDTGIDASIESISLNLLKGQLDIGQIRVKNPEGFVLENLASIEQVKVKIDLPTLIKTQQIVVQNVLVEGTVLNLIRNKHGQLNVQHLKEQLAVASRPEEQSPVGQSSEESLLEAPVKSSESAPELPEFIIKNVLMNASVRYLDFKLDQFEIALKLAVSGTNISTIRNPEQHWGRITMNGSLGDDRAQFVTLLEMTIAPLLDPQNPSFDLTGKIMEIDPRVMDDVYSKLGIRTAPFGLQPVIYCRKGLFEDSFVSMELSEIVFEEKLKDDLGGVGRIGSLRFPIAVEGSLQQPSINLEQALYGAIGENKQVVVESVLTGILQKEAGLEEPPEDLKEAAVEVLGAKVEEIGKSETAKKVLKDLVGSESSDTNAPPAEEAPVTDTILDIIGEQVDEEGEYKELKNTLKGLGRSLFGD